MHHFIYPTKTAWISSGSNKINGITHKDQNFGQDEILELKKFYYNQSFDYQTRALVQFPLTAISNSIVDDEGNNLKTYHTQGKTKFYLRLYEAEGNTELSSEYTLAAHPLSQSWDEGTGKSVDEPKVTDGVSWIYVDNKPGAAANYWNSGSGQQSYLSGSGVASQSFSYESPDVNMDVTDVVSNWLNSTNNNYGFLLRFSGSQETDSQTFGQLKFFSNNTNTIYPPKLELRWDDHVVIQGDHTGSLTELTMSGLVNNHIYMKNLNESYKETDKVKFRVGARKQYIQKTFSTSLQTASGSYIPEKSGSYSIVDVATGETIIPFSNYTYLSCDSNSNYFIQWLNGFNPDRIYKILIKLNLDDGQEKIFDNNFEFKVKR